MTNYLEVQWQWVFLAVVFPLTRGYLELGLTGLRRFARVGSLDALSLLLFITNMVLLIVYRALGCLLGHGWVRQAGSRSLGVRRAAVFGRWGWERACIEGVG